MSQDRSESVAKSDEPRVAIERRSWKRPTVTRLSLGNTRLGGLTGATDGMLTKS